MNYPRVVPAAVDAVMIEFADEISLPVHEQVMRCLAWLEKTKDTALLEWVASYRTVMVYFDLRRTDAQQVIRTIEAAQFGQQQSLKQTKSPQLHQIEVCYHPSLGLDLVELSATAGLSVEQFAQRHSEVVYRVYALGFAPGFAYLGDVPEQLRFPRLATPRKKVPAGSVAIANQQTAIYPKTSPGGWNIIGRAVRWPEFELGDRIQFKPISLAQFERMDASR